LLSVDPIGGYFDLELPRFNQEPIHSAAYRYPSARAAFLALLRVVRPKAVWMPRFICDAMLAPFNYIDVDVKYYSIDIEFNIKTEIDLAEGEIILYVDYFGLCGEKKKRVATKYGESRVVIDNSQALFSEPFECLATIYSPRKFLGVPNGGLLMTREDIDIPECVDDSSVADSEHLFQRLTGQVERGYSNYKTSEERLSEVKVEGMSVFTEALLSRIDFSYIKRVRVDNFNYCRDLFSTKSGNLFALSDDECPMIYPFFADDKNVREKLIDNKVFVATYWTDVKERDGVTDDELYLVDNLVPLPIDQRYGPKEMERVYTLLHDLM